MTWITDGNGHISPYRDSNGNPLSVYSDPYGNLPISDAFLAPQQTTWTSATAANTANTVTTSGMDTVVLTLVATGTISAGHVTFEVYDGTTWLPVKAARINSYLSDQGYTLATSTSIAWQVPVSGFPQFRCRLDTQITGAGSLATTVVVSSAPDTSIVTVGLDPGSGTANGSAVPSTQNPLDVAWDGTDQRRIAVSSIGRVAIAASGVVGEGQTNVQGFVNEGASTAIANGTAFPIGTQTLVWVSGKGAWQRANGPITSAAAAGVTAQPTASGNTALWTPNTGKKFRLMRLRIMVPGDTYLTAAAGRLTVTFQDGTTDLGLAYTILLPGAAGTTPLLWDSGPIDLGNGYLSSTANNVLNVNLSGAVTNGIRVVAQGTEE